MNCSQKQTFLIKGKNLQYGKNNHFAIQTERQRFQIIKGIVYTQNQEPCNGATIEINQINCKNNTKSLLGYVVTDRCGKYLFSLAAEPSMEYELVIYAPLT